MSNKTVILLALSTIASITFVRADPLSPDAAASFKDRFPAPIQCANPGETCKILVLSAQEERLLIGLNGILDTAAQGRQLDLGGFAVYFKQKIAQAPAGDPASPKASQDKSSEVPAKP